MYLLILACVAVFTAGCLISFGIGPRRPCDLVTGSVAISLATVALLAKVLLLLGWFRPVPVTVAAVGIACAASGWLAVSPAALGRATATGRMLAASAPRIGFAQVGCAAALAVLALVGYEAAMAVRLPPVAWDALYYHLISVADRVRTGHFVAPLPGLSSHNPVYIYFQADSFPKDGELTAAWIEPYSPTASAW